MLAAVFAVRIQIKTNSQSSFVDSVWIYVYWSGLCWSNSVWNNAKQKPPTFFQKQNVRKKYGAFELY